MLKIAVPVWMMVGTVFAGSAIMTVLSVPALAAHDRDWLPYAAVAGFVAAVPIALAVASKMQNAFTR